MNLLKTIFKYLKNKIPYTNNKFEYEEKYIHDKLGELTLCLIEDYPDHAFVQNIYQKFFDLTIQVIDTHKISYIENKTKMSICCYNHNTGEYYDIYDLLFIAINLYGKMLSDEYGTTEKSITLSYTSFECALKNNIYIDEEMYKTRIDFLLNSHVIKDVGNIIIDYLPQMIFNIEKV